MVLLEGRVKTTLAAVNGQETVVGIRGRGEIVGELACLDERLQLGSVRTLEPVRALVIDARSFRHYIATTPEAALALLEVLSQRLRDAVLKRAEFPSSDTIGRLAARLVELAERYGTASERGIDIGLPLSQEELAGWVGACHAGLAKALQVLRELGWSKPSVGESSCATSRRCATVPRSYTDCPIVKQHNTISLGGIRVASS